MKKVGILIFATALVIGIVVANIFSFGRTSTRMFNFTMSFGGVRGSGNVVTDKRTASNFKSVEVGGVFQVEITAGKEFGVEVEADDNLLPLISTDVSDGVLRISTDRKVSSRGPIRVRVYAPDIEKLEVSGVANVTVNDIKSKEFNLDSSGASKIKLTGETANFVADVSGATKIDAENLNTVDANIDCSGASSVMVNVSGDLKAEASGASKITYTGTPTSIDQSSHGSSRISQK